MSVWLVVGLRSSSVCCRVVVCVVHRKGEGLVGVASATVDVLLGKGSIGDLSFHGLGLGALTVHSSLGCVGVEVKFTFAFGEMGL
eukprot:3362263-Alexandrium_andersonii.AAC.1